MEAEQLTLEFLEQEFKVNSPRRTLRTKVHKDVDLGVAVKKAFRFVNSNKEGYTSMEFPYDGCYIVVAKLKEKSQ